MSAKFSALWNVELLLLVFATQHVRHVYEKCGKSVSKTAQALGVARNTVTGYLEA